MAMSSLPARTRIFAVGEVLREAGGYDGPLAAPGIWREVQVKPLGHKTTPCT
jgi:hypothetical protein